MKWAMDDPARFLRELAEIESLENEVDWLTTAWTTGDGGSIAVDLDIAVHGRAYAGRMTYPDMFPHSPPYIRPRDASDILVGASVWSWGLLMPTVACRQLATRNHGRGHDP